MSVRPVQAALVVKLHEALEGLPSGPDYVKVLRLVLRKFKELEDEAALHRLSLPHYSEISAQSV